MRARTNAESVSVEGQEVTAVLCPNCGSGKHARCCSWCGALHKAKRLQNEHCSASCERDATQANKLSDAMEEDWLQATEPKEKDS